MLYDFIPSHRTIAIFAPSIAASFSETYSKIPTALRKSVSKRVCETAFGADLISNLYKEEFEKVKRKNDNQFTLPGDQ
ncbi:MAG: [Fe-Fe] hydrogenase large subunit C-terminal domain-containing protein [Melioribacteraceae bacterium]|nr:[Fe-Fe] hydrogenase large subunit C-terminal domain-containing protein [Melioribacteraceae bacterium]